MATSIFPLLKCQKNIVIALHKPKVIPVLMCKYIYIYQKIFTDLLHGFIILTLNNRLGADSA